ncbi:hypothetical protein Hanom_Chr05g00408801 [Helianthus anomalus]
MFANPCELCLLAITQLIFVVKSDQMDPHIRVFLWLNLTKWTPHESKMTKIPSCEVHLVIFNNKKLTELGLKDITCKSLQISSTFSVIIENK